LIYTVKEIDLSDNPMSLISDKNWIDNVCNQNDAGHGLTAVCAETLYMMNDPKSDFYPESWFLGPKAEHGRTWSEIIDYILQDYLHWRRNYFPGDPLIVDRAQRRRHEDWFDLLSNNLDIILSQLKADYPFYSPRYMAHMLSENALPGVVGYFAGMLYNPNNVTREVAPITHKLELDVGGMIATMLGYEPEKSWSHITSGGTIANLEALWAARQNQLNGVAFAEVARKYGFDFELPLANGSHADIKELDYRELVGLAPDVSVRLPALFRTVFEQQGGHSLELSEILNEVKYGPFSITQNGTGAVYHRLGIEPVVLVSQAAHYSINKAVNLLGLGERNVIQIPLNDQFQIHLEALEEKLDQLKDNQVVLALVGILGTTEEGAVDPIDRMLALRQSHAMTRNHSFWFHVDAAWGGYLKTLAKDDPVLHPHVSAALNQIQHADSITIDPHKLGYVPYPAGVICFRDKFTVLHSHQTAPYITLDAVTPDPLDVSDVDHSIGPYIVEGSKPGASAAATWLTHKTIPLDASGHGQLIHSTLKDAKRFYDELCKMESACQDDPDCPIIVSSVNEPDINVICYVIRIKENRHLSVQNQLNKQIFKAFSLSQNRMNGLPYNQEFFVSHTHFYPSHYPVGSVNSLLQKLDMTPEDYERNGIFVLRSVIMNPWITPARTKGRDYISELIHKLVESGIDQLKESTNPLPQHDPIHS
jgi:glutamate/tyrosine decarboxylase-like PLP-dependent enzyme